MDKELVQKSIDPVSLDERFRFGKNWKRFLKVVDSKRIEAAQKSLQTELGVDRLQGKSFLDIGSGSGLFSLAAHNLGAKVTSLDFDPDSVECTNRLKQQHAAHSDWRVVQGSILDPKIAETLGKHDVVYSWGVLHHTGDMYKALEHAKDCVGSQGHLFIAIYNDQGWQSKFWLQVKKLYCSGWVGRSIVLAVFIPLFAVFNLIKDFLNGKNPLATYREHSSERGMSAVHDWIDWLGGYPFEVASTGDICTFFIARGFDLRVLKSKRGWGTNQYVFQRVR